MARLDVNVELTEHSPDFTLTTGHGRINENPRVDRCMVRAMTLQDDDDDADDLRDEEDPDESDTDDDGGEDDADWADPPRRQNLLWVIVAALTIVAMLVWALRGRL